MDGLSILVFGGGIGGLSAAIALCRCGHDVTFVERDPTWSVYGVGIIQQPNVLRAMDQLGLLDAFLDAACGFDAVEVFAPDGAKVARVPSPKLVTSAWHKGRIGPPADNGRATREMFAQVAQPI
jgi:2-polyprenyl-6-methoxyphenol hydroxylase-like FAD-dependent oxidoreductase